MDPGACILIRCADADDGVHRSSTMMGMPASCLETAVLGSKYGSVLMVQPSLISKLPFS